MRVLVLGGTGAMGEPLVRLLSRRGDEVYATSRRKRESNGNVHFIQGDARELSFVQEVLKTRYDAIVDFMIYPTVAFKKRTQIYLDNTDQYLFLSSARVYADSKRPITESSPRLLDVCKDEAYLKTDEYALAKARSENILFEADRKNWTIIRPYITYNTKRLQLGGLELDTWLTAALSGRPLVLPKDVGIHETTMTYGDDVAYAMMMLIGKKAAYGEAFHITGTDHMTWNEVVEIYKDVIEDQTGKRPEIYTPDTSSVLSAVMKNTTQIQYDRMYDRIFDNSKLMEAIRDTSKEEMNFLPMKKGLQRCLKKYFSLPYEQSFNVCNLNYLAQIDKSTRGRTSLSGVEGSMERFKYLGYYYTPGALETLKKVKRRLYV